MLSIDDLEKFVLVAKLGSMRRAADHFGLAPSAISRQIARIEHSFNAVMFERRADGVTLTDAGETTLLRAVEILHQLTDLQADLTHGDRPSAGAVTLATIEGVTKGFLAPLIAGFRRLHPETSVHLNVVGRKLVLESVEDYQAEIGIVYDHFSNPAVATVAKWKQPLLCFVRPGHPLLAMPPSQAALKDWPCALPDQTFGIRRLVDMAYRKRRLPLAHPVVANQLQSLIQASIESDLITFMPLQAARFEVENGLLVPIETGFAEFQHRFVSIVVRKGRPQSHQVELFLAALLARIDQAEIADRRLLAQLPESHRLQ